MICRDTAVLTAVDWLPGLATVTVLPQLSGYLTEVGYREGQDVTKGQFLAQIDPRQYEIDLRQAEAQLADIRAQIDQDIRNALLDLKSSADQVEVAQSSVNLADQALVQSQAATDQGVGLPIGHV